MLAAKDYSKVPEKRWKKIEPCLDAPRNVLTQEYLMQLVHSNLDMKHWLADGALLCIYRNGRLLTHNRDVDILVDAKDIARQITELKRIFIKCGCAVRAMKQNTRLNVFYKGELVSIEGYERRGKFMVKKNRRVPVRYFGDGTIEFNGVTYPCLTPIEKFLSWRYLHWKNEYTGNPSKRTAYINKKKLMGKIK
jgi:hypothetical protein